MKNLDTMGSYRVDMFFFFCLSFLFCFFYSVCGLAQNGMFAIPPGP